MGTRLKSPAYYISRIRIARNVFRSFIDGLIYLESFLHGRNRRVPGKRRILILRKDALGDCIIFYPTLRAYRDYYRDSELTLVFPKYFESLKPILDGLTDKIIWFDNEAFGSNLWYRRRFMLEIAREGYDIFIYPVFSRETMGYFLKKITRAPESVSFDGEISKHGPRLEEAGIIGFTRLIKPPEKMGLEIERDRFFAETLTGRKIDIKFPTIDVSRLPAEGDVAIMRNHGLEPKKYAVIFPGSGALYKIWPREKWAAVIDHIASKELTPVVCGSKKERGLVKSIIAISKPRQKAIDLCGQTDLPALAHILADAKLYFGSDTGILHLAVAVGCPTVAVVGMGALNRFFPYGDSRINRAVFDRTRQWKTGSWENAHLLPPGTIHPSIANITVDEAEKEIDSMLEYLA